MKFRRQSEDPRAADVKRTSSTIAILVALIGLTVIHVSSVALSQTIREMFVSIIQLIANPTAFDQKRVLVMGYAVLKFESQHIYLSETDAKHGITKNSLWLDVSDQLYAERARFDQRYVLVEGTFNARRRGHLGLSSGSLENIGRLEPLD
jgi:hypothetical protein